MDNKLAVLYSRMSSTIRNFERPLRESALANAVRPTVHKVRLLWQDATRYPRYISHFGFAHGHTTYRKLYNTKEEGRLVRLRMPALSSEVFLRPKTTDVDVFEQVFLQRDYQVKLPPAPEYLIDAGAHIGLASVYFANRFPQCHILALEPELSNYRLLECNAKPYSNITPLRAGLWSRRASLKIKDPCSGTWSFQLKEGAVGEGDVDVITVQEAMQHIGADRIGILKMDIEGAELEVLQTSNAWIGKIDALIVELHGELRKEGSRVLEAAVRSGEFEQTHQGENVVVVRADVLGE